MKVELRALDTDSLRLVLPLIADYHAFEALDGTIWLIYCDTELAGYIALCRGFSIEFNGFDAFIDEFFLAEPFRGRGLGARVLEQIRSQARARDINALHLEVARDNPAAQRLYHKAGFEAREKYLLMTALLD